MVGFTIGTPDSDLDSDVKDSDSTGRGLRSLDSDVWDSDLDSDWVDSTTTLISKQAMGKSNNYFCTKYCKIMRYFNLIF